MFPAHISCTSSKFRWIQVKCCAKEILCTQSFKNFRTMVIQTVTSCTCWMEDWPWGGTYTPIHKKNKFSHCKSQEPHVVGQQSTQKYSSKAIFDIWSRVERGWWRAVRHSWVKQRSTDQRNSIRPHRRCLRALRK